MGRAALCMRAAALLAAAGMFIFLAEGISADNEIAEAVTARALKTTQINGTVPQDEYDTIFHIQWGGGSLYQLKARLATHGCMLDIVWVYDNEQWYPYSQYNVPHSLQQEFLEKYTDNIPAGTLYATCYDLCTFKYDDSVVATLEEELRDHFEALYERDFLLCETTEQLRENYDDTNPKKNAECTQDWHKFTNNNIFPILPRLGKVCIYRLDVDYNSQGSYGPMNSFSFRENVWYSSFLEPDITVETNKDLIFENEQHKRNSRLSTEIHEVCHNHQEWMVAQSISPYSLLPAHHIEIGYNTPAMRALIELVGYTAEDAPREYLRRIWSLPKNSVFRKVYSTSPKELGAELCSFYILTKHNRNITDYSKVLTPEIIQWLEAYIFVLQDPQ